MPDYRVKLTIEMPELIKFSGRDYFRVKVTASDGENMPNEIFVHQKTLVDPDQETTQDEFCAIAGPYDLSAYPITAPNAGQVPPFFRKAVIDVLLPSSSHADDFITEIKSQVEALTTALKTLDDLQTTQIVWIPNSP